MVNPFKNETTRKIFINNIDSIQKHTEPKTFSNIYKQIDEIKKNSIQLREIRKNTPKYRRKMIRLNNKITEFNECIETIIFSWEIETAKIDSEEISYG